MKAILAAVALALTAAAVPAAAYEGEHRRNHNPSVTYQKGHTGRDLDRRDTRTYRVDRHDRDEVREHRSGRRWWHRRQHWNDDYAEYRPHRYHRRWWRRYWD